MAAWASVNIVTFSAVVCRLLGEHMHACGGYLYKWYLYK